MPVAIVPKKVLPLTVSLEMVEVAREDVADMKLPVTVVLPELIVAMTALVIDALGATKLDATVNTPAALRLATPTVG